LIWKPDIGRPWKNVAETHSPEVCVGSGQEGAQRLQTPGRLIQAGFGAIPAEAKTPLHFA
jgi:hypothetical protein